MTSGRLLALLSLLQTPREWPGSELAQRLEVSPRTIRRDVERLRDLGYPVRATMGAEGGYRLAAGTAMPPLLLDDEEAVAIAVGLRTATRQPVTGIGEASVRALAKLEQVLPSRLRRRVAALGAATVPVDLAGDGPGVDPEHLASIAGAIANRERLRFHYRAADGSESRRHVEPTALVPSGRRWYLLAFDVERDDWRVFRVDRVERVLATGARAAVRELPAADAATYMRERMLSGPPVYRAEVTVDLPLRAVRERLGDTPEELREVGEGRTWLRTHADTLEYVAFRIVLLGCDFEVHTPVELVSYLRDLRSRIDRAVGP
ncbi:YafY family protein [Saccharothrix sp. NPDC042600]|uniref:helix-turn-helix transcriptional regulator n=1 Tax=Saccharothrix TaxID=2071 RepID=UPI0033FDF406|nr:YafY family protein [Saccharothrix mutabilis subsp. capreolus]